MSFMSALLVPGTVPGTKQDLVSTSDLDVTSPLHNIFMKLIHVSLYFPLSLFSPLGGGQLILSFTASWEVAVWSGHRNMTKAPVLLRELGKYGKRRKSGEGAAGRS